MSDGAKGGESEEGYDFFLPCDCVAYILHVVYNTSLLEKSA